MVVIIFFINLQLMQDHLLIYLWFKIFKEIGKLSHCWWPIGGLQEMCCLQFLGVNPLSFLYISCSVIGFETTGVLGLDISRFGVSWFGCKYMNLLIFLTWFGQSRFLSFWDLVIYGCVTLGFVTCGFATAILFLYF